MDYRNSKINPLLLLRLWRKNHKYEFIIIKISGIDFKIYNTIFGELWTKL